MSETNQFWYCNRFLSEAIFVFLPKKRHFCRKMDEFDRFLNRKSPFMLLKAMIFRTKSPVLFKIMILEPKKIKFGCRNNAVFIEKCRFRSKNRFFNRKCPFWSRISVCFSYPSILKIYFVSFSMIACVLRCLRGFWLVKKYKKFENFLWNIHVCARVSCDTKLIPNRLFFQDHPLIIYSLSRS